MENRKYDFFESVNLALYDCKKVTNLHNNKTIEEAYKHIESFEKHINNVLLASIYEQGDKGYKPGIILFCDSFLSYRNKSGFSIDEGVIQYEDISEMNINLKGGMFKLFGLTLILKNGENIPFVFNEYYIKYILKQIYDLSFDKRFPFFFVDQQERQNEFIFANKFFLNFPEE